MRPPFRDVAESIEQVKQLDHYVKPLQRAIPRAIPQDSLLKELLSGTWLGHPLHPLLTDVVLGAWASASFLDVFGGKASQKAADRLVALGILTALPTAAAGLSDWAELSGGTARVGLVHAGGNLTGLLLQMASYRSRKKGHRFRGRVLSMLAMGGAVGSGYLGGHLSFGRGVGVDQTAFEERSKSWKTVLKEGELPQGKLTSARAGAVAVVLYRKGETIYALSDRCTHRGCPLSDGEVRGTNIVCPCHTSTFRLEDGQVVSGPATAPQPRFTVRIQNGNVQVRAAS